MKVDFGGKWMKQHQKVFKLTSLLLHYPNEEWLSKLDEIKSEIATINNQVINAYLNAFMTYLEKTPYDELCERYVKTFDFFGVTTLNLTYNVFKDSRDRGTALIKLRQIFSESEMMPLTDELPDFVPLILEFLAVCEDELVEKLLKLHFNSFTKLENDLEKNDSDYHFLAKAIVEVASEHLKNVKAS